MTRSDLLYHMLVDGTRRTPEALTKAFGSAWKYPMRGLLDLEIVVELRNVNGVSFRVLKWDGLYERVT